MTVKHILDIKGRDVTSIGASATIAQAAQLLTERKIGALVCLGEGRRILGIVSERDIVRAIAANGASALDRALSDFMTREVTTCNEAMTVDEAMELMTRSRFRHLPVCEGGELVGIISIGDAVKRRIEDVEREADYMRTYIHAG